MNTIAVIGEGAWGTAIAVALSHAGHEVRLWCYHANSADEIIRTRINSRYMSGIELSERIHPTTDLADTVNAADIICEAIPVVHLRSILERIQPVMRDTQQWVILSKGIEQQTLLFPSQLVQELCNASYSPVVISGPSFAREVATQQPTAMVCASEDRACAMRIKALFDPTYISTTIADDVIGVQIGGALKNVIAIGVGLLAGAGYGDNLKALLITRGLEEIAGLAHALGGSAHTIYGLSGVGDLLLTAYGTSSKNRAVGYAVGQGQSLATFLQTSGYIPEGINTVKSVVQLGKKWDVLLPICAAIHDVIDGTMSTQSFLQLLMS